MALYGVVTWWVYLFEDNAINYNLGFFTRQFMTPREL